MIDVRGIDRKELNMNFQYDYRLSGSNRKPLVEAISQILGQPAVYQGAPSFAYRIGGYTVDRNGVLSCEANTRPEIVKTLVEALRERGFVAENSDFLTVEIPRAGFTEQALINLQKIVDSKATLLKLALDTDNLEITTDGEKIYFPWFRTHDIAGESDAYIRLISAICDMAKRQKRVTATEKPIENAKFSMRLFLIRLGFIGDEYKNARKILLRNLNGNSSWKHGVPPERSNRQAQSQTTTIPPSPTQAAVITDYNRLLTSGLAARVIETADMELFPEKGGIYGK